MVNVFDVANYFLSLVDHDAEDNITNLKLQKLCYYAQGFNLAIKGERLFDSDIEAWQHGPVIPELYHKYKEMGKTELYPDDNFDINKIPEDTKDLLNEVYDVYGQFSAWRLRDMTHAEEPWKSTFSMESNNNVISDNKMTDFSRHV